MSAVKLLYLPLLLASHTTVLGTLTNVILILLHDFVQHAVQTSHRWHGILDEIFQRRYILSATLGTQLYYINQALLQAALFALVAFTDGDFAVLLQAFLNGQKLDGVRIAAMHLATIPECIVNTAGYWLAAIGFSGLCMRRRNDGYHTDHVCIDDVIIGAALSTAGLRFGVCMLRMLAQGTYSRIVPTITQGTTAFEWGMIPGEIFDLLGFLSCQTLLAAGVAADSVLGKVGMTRRAVVKTFFVEVVVRLLRLGMGVSWGWWGFNLANLVVANLVLVNVIMHARDIVEDLKVFERRREKIRERM